MTTPATPETPLTTTPVPWYSLHPRHLRFSKFTWYFLAIAGVIILLYTVSVKPLWQYGWRVGLYGFSQYWTQTSTRGKKIPGGSWTRTRTILVYGEPGVKAATVRQAAEGLSGLIAELHLSLTVRVVSAPVDACAALKDATITTTAGTAAFDLDRFIAHRLDDRGDRFGEMVVVHAPFTDPPWAWGLTYFPCGIAALQEDHTDYNLGRHEGAHLIGYDKHDDMPLYIIGYAENPIPTNRDTLMMLLPMGSNTLSPRARDALRNFWRGLEHRHGMRYFM